jgi:hypothetical protein
MVYNSMEKTKVVSVRVPARFYNELKSYCTRNNTTTSKVLMTGYSGIIEKGIFKVPEIDSNAAEFLITTSGGGVAGILVYKAVYRALSDKTSFSQTEKQILSIASGTTVALLVGYGLAKLIKLLRVKRSK